MFSKSCEYAIKAMIFVAQKSKDRARVSVKDIAKSTDAPEHFIAKIMQELGRKRLVTFRERTEWRILHGSRRI